MGSAVIVSSGVLELHSAGKACGTQITQLRGLAEGREPPQKEQGRWRSMTPGGPAMPQTLKLAHAVR
jgi:hypothetical protein